MRLGITTMSKDLLEDLDACYKLDDQFKILSKTPITSDTCFVTFSSTRLPYGINRIDHMSFAVPDQYKNMMYLSDGKRTRYTVEFESVFLGRREMI